MASCVRRSDGRAINTSRPFDVALLRVLRQDNVDPLKEVEVRRIPTCELFCPSPPPPPGYVKLHDLLLVDENGTEINRDPAYTCASGWTGTPNHTCSINSTTCAVPVSLQGCFQMLPCKPIDPRSFDVCTFNITDCVEKSQTTIAEYTGPAPGAACQLSCREPMRGKGVASVIWAYLGHLGVSAQPFFGGFLAIVSLGYLRGSPILGNAHFLCLSPPLCMAFLQVTTQMPPALTVTSIPPEGCNMTCRRCLLASGVRWMLLNIVC
ncbi:unnamed protein product [Symbiodinium natans]|uniref:Uncharacterized protein n=1 Tax=Symbiodinium natans TaxID=878477 RepID=A0A812IJ98_9DINO|nr:unnamed protein product [Symbiodinium natans]